jgi:hypothetical protein
MDMSITKKRLINQLESLEKPRILEVGLGSFSINLCLLGIDISLFCFYTRAQVLNIKKVMPIGHELEHVHIKT